MGCLPAYYPGYQRVNSDPAREGWEKVWGVSLSPKPGNTKVTALDEMIEGKVRGVYIMGENTVVSDANASYTIKALEAADFIVVQDLFMTETAKMADVVLPAASFAEVDGTYTNSERRVQRVRKAIDPPGQARADWEIVMDLGARMGYDMHYDHPSEIWDEMTLNTPILAGIHYDRIDQIGLQWPCPTDDHPGTPFLHGDAFVTPKGYFQPVGHVPPAEQPDADFPLVLTTGRRRSTYHTGTMTGRAIGFDQLVKSEMIELSPEDAAQLNVTDGETVDIVSRRGRVRAPVWVTDRSPAGLVFMSFHFPEGALTNVLTSEHYDPITETPEFKACAVRIEKVAA